MRFPLLLLGAVVALTVGAVSLAGSVPTASLSALPTSLAAPFQEASQPAEIVSMATPAATTAVNVPIDTSTTTAEVTTQETVAPPAANAIPAECTAAIQMIQTAPGGKMGPARAVIASAIAGCFGQLPAAGIDVKIDADSGHGGGGAGG